MPYLARDDNLHSQPNSYTTPWPLGAAHCGAATGNAWEQVTIGKLYGVSPIRLSKPLG